MKRCLLFAFIVPLLLSGCAASSSVNPMTADEQTLIEDVWEQIDGYWSNPNAEREYYQCFEYSDDTGATSHSGWYYSERLETAYATAISRDGSNIYNMTFRVPSNEDEILYEIHDEYTFALKIDLSEIKTGTMRILSDIDGEIILEHFADSLEEALEKYDALNEIEDDATNDSTTNDYPGNEDIDLSAAKETAEKRMGSDLYKLGYTATIRSELLSWGYSSDSITPYILIAVEYQVQSVSYPETQIVYLLQSPISTVVMGYMHPVGDERSLEDVMENKDANTKHAKLNWAL